MIENTDSLKKNDILKMLPVYDSISDYILICDNTKNIIFINESAKSSLDIVESSLINMNISKILSEENNHQIDTFLSGKKTSVIIDDFQILLTSEKIFFMKANIIKTSDSKAELLIFILRSESDKLIDLKQLKIEKNKYRLLIMNLQSAFTYNKIIVNSESVPVDFLLLEVNMAFENLTGVKRTKMLGKRASDSIPDIFFEDPNLINTLGNVALTGLPEKIDDMYFESINKWFSLFVYSTEPGYFAMVLNDITPSKQMETQTLAAIEATESAYKTKSDFIANMSHEIRTPLNGILGMTELLMLSSIDDDQKEKLDILHNCSKSLLKIINDVLDFSKLEAGKFFIEKYQFDLRQTIEDVIAVHTTRATKKGLELSYSLPNNLPKIIIGDAHRLQQILNNLLSNAIKFTDSGEIELFIKKMNKGSNHIELKFVVNDSGIGISPENMNKLFLSFSQVDSSKTRRFGGTGLGLAICKQLVELMNGTIGVDSQTGVGSSFYFTISFELPPNNTNKEIVKNNEILESIINKELNEKRKILLVEDDLINQIVISQMLNELGYQCTIAGNGKNGIELFTKEDFDLVLLDIQMPEMDGFQTLSAIRVIDYGRNKYTPVSALTAFAMEGDREKFLSIGMDGYISKPCQIQILEETIQSLLKVSKEEMKQNINANSSTDENVNTFITKELKKDTTEVKLSTISKIKENIDLLSFEVNRNNFTLIERISHVLNSLGSKAGFELIKLEAFKIELASRKNDIHQCKSHLKDLMDVLKDIESKTVIQKKDNF